MSKELSERHFRDAMGTFCTGVVVVSAMREEGPVGFSVQSFVSLSLDPPLIAVCPANGGSSWPRIRDCAGFGINILSANQAALCKQFATQGIDRFDNVSWQASARGTPMLDDTLGFIECVQEAEHDAGDHTVVVARVVDFKSWPQGREPLLFYRGEFGSFQAG